MPRTVVIFFLILGWLSVGVASIPAGAQMIALDYALGFNGYFRLGTWTPLTVTVENRGRAVRGTLEVVVTSGSEFFRTMHQTVHAADLDLPYNSTQRATFTIHLSAFTHDALIRLRDGDGILASAAVSLRARYTEKPIVVVLDDRITPDFLSVLPSERFAVNALPRFLPETVFGYDGVEMLIINAGVLGSLRDRQFQALRDWLRQGGFLVTSGSMNYGVFQEPRWQQLLPLRILGHQEFAALPALTEFSGQPLTGSQPFLVVRATLPGGQVVLEEQGVPLLTIQPIGAGRLVFLAFDLQHPPFSRWPGRAAFWQRVADLRPQGLPKTVELAQAAVRDALLTNMPAGFPDRRLTFGFLGVYLIAFKIITITFGRRGADNRRILIGVAALTLVFSAASYGLFTYPAQQRDVAYDSLLHVHASGNAEAAHGEFMLGVFGLKRAAYTLGFGDAVYPIRPILPDNPHASPPAPYVLHQTATGQRIRGELEQWSSSFFTMTTPVDFRMRAAARYTDGEGLRLDVENPTPRDLEAVHGYFAGRLFPLGTVAAARKAVKTLRPAQIQARELFDAAKIRALLPPVADAGHLPFWQRMQRELLRSALISTHATYHGQEDVIILIGWLPSAEIDVLFEHSGSVGASATLVTWVIPVE